MKYLVMVLILMFAVPSMAEVKTNGLTKEQIAQLESQKAQFALSNAQNPTISVGTVSDALGNPETLNKYTDIGVGIAKALGAAAKELGTEVNAFASSPVGKIVVFLTVYTLFGAEFVTMLVGFFFMIPMTIWVMHRINKFIRTAEIKYDDKGKEIGRVYHTAEEASYSKGDGMSAFGAQAAITVVGMTLIAIQALIYLP